MGFLARAGARDAGGFFIAGDLEIGVIEAEFNNAAAADFDFLLSDVGVERRFFVAVDVGAGRLYFLQDLFKTVLGRRSSGFFYFMKTAFIIVVHGMVVRGAVSA